MLDAEEVTDRCSQHALCLVLDLTSRTTRGNPMPHVPVLVGGGQLTDRPDDPTAGLEPLALMEQAARRAIEDTRGGPALLAAVDTLVAVNVLCFDYGDAA